MSMSSASVERRPPATLAQITTLVNERRLVANDRSSIAVAICTNNTTAANAARPSSTRGAGLYSGHGGRDIHDRPYIPLFSFRNWVLALLCHPHNSRKAVVRMLQ